MPITTPLKSRFHRQLHYSLPVLCLDRNLHGATLAYIKQAWLLLAIENASLNQVSHPLFWLISGMWFPMFLLMFLYLRELGLPQKKYGQEIK